MIPNVTARWCQKQAKCWYDGCTEPITPGQAMVAVFFWRKGSDSRKWNIQHCYHAECWLRNGMDYLNRNPYVPHRSTGRKRLELSEEARRERFLIVRRYHALRQRLDQLDNGSEPIKALRIESLMMELFIEIQPVGGVPKSWLERM